MRLSKKLMAVAAGALAMISAASWAQDSPTKSEETIAVSGSLEWLEKSDVSALKEGVIRQIEFQVGKRVAKDKEIGSLRDEMAKLTLAKAALVAKNTGEISKANAQRMLAMSELARLQRLELKGPGFVSQSEKEKAQAELAVADALRQVAMETQKVNEADRDLAQQAVDDHVIRAPFEGVITDRMKFPGESVRANEPVVRIGRTDRLRFLGMLPIEVANRLKGNEVIDLRPTIEGADLPIEGKVFRGRITALSREITSVRSTDVQILAEIENWPIDVPKPSAAEKEAGAALDPQLELLVGMKADATIYLGGAAPKVAANKKTR